MSRWARRLRDAVQGRGLPGLARRLWQKIGEALRTVPPPLTVESALAWYRLRPEVFTPTDATPVVSILLLTHNNLPMTQACLLSIFANTPGPEFEVIVVDNASTDGTQDWLKTFASAHANVHLILNAENLGFPAGNNQAARKAIGEYLVFLNNDTLVTPGWIEGLLARLRADPSIGLVGPVTNATSNEARLFVTYSQPQEMEALAAHLRRTQAGNLFEIRMLALYCVMARREEFLALGGLDERYGMGMFEDEDLARSYLEGGFRSVCAPDVLVHHFWRAAFRKMDAEQYDRVFAENRRKFEAKWGLPWTPYDYSPLYTGPHAGDAEKLTFHCNLCGRDNTLPVPRLHTEAVTCACGSSVRTRGLWRLFTEEMFIGSPSAPRVHGEPKGAILGDPWLARALRSKLNLTETPTEEGTLDFVISRGSPQEAARWLRPGGLLALSAASEDDLPGGGFEQVRIPTEPYWDSGVYWMDPWPLPVLARRV